MAVEILINGTVVDTNPEFSIPVDLYNRMLKLNDIELTSFTFSLPLSDRNLPVFSHINRIQQFPYRVPEGNMTVLVDGITFYEGEFYVNQADDNSVEVFFGISFNSDVEKIKEKYLNELDYNGPITIGNSLAAGVNYISQQGSDINNPDFYCFPVANRQWQADIASNDALVNPENPDNNLFDWTVNPMDNSGIQNYILTGLLTGSTTSWNFDVGTISVFPKMNAILKAIFREIDYTLENNIFETEDEIKCTCFYSNYLWYNDFFEQDPNDPVSLDLRKFVPEKKVLDFLYDVESDFNIHFLFNPLSRTVRISKNEAVFVNTPVEDITARCKRGKTVLIPENDGLLFTREQNEDLYSSGVRFFDNADYLLYDGRISQITNFNNPSFAVSVHSVPILFDVWRNPFRQRKSVSIDGNKPSFKFNGYDPQTENPKEVKSGLQTTSMTLEGKTRIAKAILGTINGMPIFDTEVIDTRMPAVAVSVINNQLDESQDVPDRQPVPAIMMLYRGMKEVSTEWGSFFYPYGSSDVLAMNGITREFEISLMLVDDITKTPPSSAGIIRIGFGQFSRVYARTKNWYKERSPKIRVPMEVDAAWLKNIQWDRPYIYQGRSVVFDRISADINPRGIEMAEVTLCLI